MDEAVGDFIFWTVFMKNKTKTKTKTPRGGLEPCRGI